MIISQDKIPFVKIYSFSIQIDTVIDESKDKQSSLTVILCDSSYMLITLLTSLNAKPDIDVFNQLENILGFDEFKRLVSLFLTDNGFEFSKVLEFEHSLSGEKRCHIFSAIRCIHTKIVKLKEQMKTFDLSS